MRSFSDFEKDMIRLISEIKPESNETFLRFLKLNYFTKERKQALLINYETKDVIFYLSPEVFNNAQYRTPELKNFWTLISLIRYLSKQREISNIPIERSKGLEIVFEEFDSSSQLDQTKLILNSKGDYLLTSDPGNIFDDKGQIKLIGISWSYLYTYISDNLLGIIFPSEGIKYLVNNDFQSEEDRRYHKQVKLTWIGIIISSALSMYGICSDLSNSVNDSIFKFEILKKVNSINIQTKKINQNILATHSEKKILKNINRLEIKKDSAYLKK